MRWTACRTDGWRGEPGRGPPRLPCQGVAVELVNVALTVGAGRSMGDRRPRRSPFIRGHIAPDRTPFTGGRDSARAHRPAGGEGARAFGSSSKPAPYVLRGGLRCSHFGSMTRSEPFGPDHQSVAALMRSHGYGRGGRVRGGARHHWGATRAPDVEMTLRMAAGGRRTSTVNCREGREDDRVRLAHHRE